MNKIVEGEQLILFYVGSSNLAHPNNLISLRCASLFINSPPYLSSLQHLSYFFLEEEAKFDFEHAIHLPHNWAKLMEHTEISRDILVIYIWKYEETLFNHNIYRSRIIAIDDICYYKNYWILNNSKNEDCCSIAYSIVFSKIWGLFFFLNLCKFDWVMSYIFSC